ALEFIGDDHTRHVRQSLEELTEEPLCRPLIPAALYQDIQHAPILIHRPPQIVTFALDPQKYLVHMPLVAGPRTSATQLIRILLAKLFVYLHLADKSPACESGSLSSISPRRRERYGRQPPFPRPPVDSPPMAGWHPVQKVGT